MSFGSLVATIVIEGLIALAILYFMWPNTRSAARLLRRWGVATPTETEQAQALTYLRRRRLWYPWLFIGLPAVFGLTGLLPANDVGDWSIPAMLLIGALLAEMFAQRRDPNAVRTAVPVRRGLTDLVPAWALVLNAITALAAVLMLGAAIAGVGWARQWYSDWSARVLWIALGAAVLTVLAVAVIVGLALRRPPVAALRIDSLLRVRSARVPVGLGIATLCSLISGGHGDFRSMIIFFVGLCLWSVIANPSRRAVPA